jgi:WXG100 family type VII secretion target
MSDTNIQVDAAKLRSLAESLDKVQNSLRESCYSANGQIESLRNIWTGDAATSYQTSFKKLMDDCNEALTVMGKMVNSLYDSADRYDKTMKTVENDVKNIPKLPTNMFQ